MNIVQKRVLVVDDQNNWRELLHAILVREGYDVQFGDSFESAQEKIKNNEFDLFILDVRLADEDTFNVQGLELLKLTKDKQTKARAIILTGYPESIREGVLDTLMADTLMYKVPAGGRFDMQQFVKKTKQLLDSSV